MNDQSESSKSILNKDLISIVHNTSQSLKDKLKIDEKKKRNNTALSE